MYGNAYKTKNKRIKKKKKKNKNAANKYIYFPKSNFGSTNRLLVLVYLNRNNDVKG